LPGPRRESGAVRHNISLSIAEFGAREDEPCRPAYLAAAVGPRDTGDRHGDIGAAFLERACAIAQAVAMDTEPKVSSTSLLTPATSCFISLE